MALRTVLCGLAIFSAACGGPSSLPQARSTPGRAVPVGASSNGGLPEGHPASSSALRPGDELPLGDPASNDGHVGRAVRRLSVDQLRASLLAATGHTWVASRRVSDPDSPFGATQLPDADMLEALAATLGKPDYVTSTSESIDPAVTFAKLANDAARSACRASVKDDLTPGNKSKFILHEVTPKDTPASNPAAFNRNLSYLALRFWGRHIDPGSPELLPLVHLFEKVDAPPGNTAEAWRAVCIAMATDPQFLTY